MENIKSDLEKFLDAKPNIKHITIWADQPPTPTHWQTAIIYNDTEGLVCKEHFNGDCSDTLNRYGFATNPVLL